MNHPEGGLGVPPEESQDTSTRIEDHIGGGLWVPARTFSNLTPGSPDISIHGIEYQLSQPAGLTDQSVTFNGRTTAPTGLPSPLDLTGKPTAPADGFDQIKKAHEALNRVGELLASSAELSQRITNEATRLSFKAKIDNLKRQLDALDQSGANASTNQVLVVVLAWSEAEEELASRAQSSDSDKGILDAIEQKFLRGRPAFWTALASLGKVKEWSVHLDISANLFAVKGLFEVNRDALPSGYCSWCG